MLAGRAKVGSYVGTRRSSESPPDLLFFAGGGGSIRGYAYRSIGVETSPSPARTRSWSAARGWSRSRASCATGSTRAGAAVGFVDSGLVTAGRRTSAARATSAPASASACATSPASASCAPTSRPRSTRAPSDSRGGALHRHRAGVLRRILAALGVLVLVAIAAVAQDAGDPQRQRLPDQPAAEPALGARPADPAERRLRRALLAGADRSASPSPTPRAPGSQIDNAELDWNRLALLRGRVDGQPARTPSASPGCAAPRRRRRPAPLPQAEAQALRPARAAGLDQPRASSQLDHVTLRRAGVRPGRRALGHRRAQPRRRRARHHARRQAPRRAGRRARGSRPPSPTPPASSTSTWRCRSRRAAWSPRCSRSRARRRSTSGSRAPARSTRWT